MIYLASPYSHPDPDVRYARWHSVALATARLIEAGLVVFSPIVHSHHLVQFGLPDGTSWWIKLDRHYIERSDMVAVLMLDGWEDSKGVACEVQIAKERGMPVGYINHEDILRNERVPGIVERLRNMLAATEPA